MRKGNRIYGIIAVLLLSLGACSLIHDDMEELGYREDGSAYAYVSLTIHTGTTGNVTRANPTGGETGNGYEKGQDYENEVNNLTLFFYPAASGNISGVNQADVEFTAKVYISPIGTSTNVTQQPSNIDKTFTVGPVKVNGLKTNQQYHVLAVANAENQTGISSLDALRSATVSTVYTATTSTEGTTSYSNFVMASEGDENPVLEISYENSETNPAETTIDLERLVARVDYQVGDNADTDFEIDGRQITATITRAFLVNTYNQDQETFVLKRVADEWNANTFDYLGKETYNNYVIDPNTSAKTLDAASTNASWYDHYFPNLSDEVGDDGKTKWENWLIQGDPITEPGTTDTWYRLGYPKENTSSVDAQGKYYSTGVVFEASYKGIDGVAEGSTFFRYKGMIYPTLEAAMEDTYNEASFKEDQTFGTFKILTEYINSLPGNEDPAGYKDYLKTAKADNFGDGSLWTWRYYKQYILSFNEKGQATAKTREVLHDRGYGTETFLNGRGYYIYWIRHNGGDSNTTTQFDETRPMAYGIVRNNVYKLTVNSISKIGDDTPRGNATLDILVAVKNWQKLPDDEVKWNN